MSKIAKEMEELGIVPVVVLDDAKNALPLATALCKGGLPCAEVTFRTGAAEESLRIMAQEFPQMVLGAGTVLTKEQADRAVAAGAKFIVSPGVDKKIIKHCGKIGIPVFPGIVTPSDAIQAIHLGLSLVKFFPAEAAGGLAMIKALAAPFTMLRFMPTGGVSPSNVQEYLQYDKIFACGGSWMVAANLIKEGRFDEIEAMTKEAVAIVKEIRA